MDHKGILRFANIKKNNQSIFPLQLKAKPCQNSTGLLNYAPIKGGFILAPVRGFEPLTTRLTVECATVAPHRNGLFLKRAKTLKFNRFVCNCQGIMSLLNSIISFPLTRVGFYLPPLHDISSLAPHAPKGRGARELPHL